MKTASALWICLVLAACDSKSAPPASSNQKTAEPAAAPAPAPAEPAVAAAKPMSPEPPKPAMVLGETPADKLGTVPEGLGLKVGSKAPDATLPDITGASQNLAALYGQGPTFVVFYRGGWCPFCNLQLHDLSQAKPEFDKRGIRIVAISVDQPGEEAKTQAKNEVAFPMLSDSDLATHKAFNVVHVLAEAEAKALAGHGVDLEKYSGQAHHSIAVPSIFLVDRAGKVRWVHVDKDYKTRPSPTQLLAVAEPVLAK